VNEQNIIYLKIP